VTITTNSNGLSVRAVSDLLPAQKPGRLSMALDRGVRQIKTKRPSVKDEEEPA